MRLLYENLITLLWVAFLVYWQIMARGAKTTQRLEPASSRILRAFVFLIAIALFSVREIPVPWLYRRFLPHPWACYNIGIVLTALGIAFAIWARIHLGANWSRSVTVKKDHELIVTGPYRLVRHPIYTGILFGFVGTAVAIGQWRGVVAVALVFWALWRKLRLEEAWMREEFGASYEGYRHRVRALVPWIV